VQLMLGDGARLNHGRVDDASRCPHRRAAGWPPATAGAADASPTVLGARPPGTPGAGWLGGPALLRSSPKLGGDNLGAIGDSRTQDAGEREIWPLAQLAWACGGTISPAGCACGGASAAGADAPGL